MFFAAPADKQGNKGAALEEESRRSEDTFRGCSRERGSTDRAKAREGGEDGTFDYPIYGPVAY